MKRYEGMYSQWLRRGLGTAALVSLMSCAGLEDPGEPDEPAPPAKPTDPAKPVDPGQNGPGQIPGQTPDPGSTVKAAPYAAGELLVRFKQGTSMAAILSAHAAHRTQLIRSYRIPSNLHLVRLPDGLGVERALAEYRKNPDVLYAEPNYRYQLTSTFPDDPMLDDLWGLNNTGQTGGVFDADINAPEAWDMITGSSDVVIGVLDTGVDYLHEDLAANMFVNPGEIAGNGVDDDGNGYVDDIHGIDAVNETGDPVDTYGHGTHVSGTIAAQANNGIGVAGVSWQARIVSCRAFDPWGELDDLLQCMDYFLELKTRAEHPVDIVATNNSWGGGAFSQALYDAIEAHRLAGMLFVAAAGNNGENTDLFPHYPSSYDRPNIISVLATDAWDSRAFFSNYGARSVDVGAPGDSILSTVPGNAYDWYSGTSMATPHVTGLVALLKAQDPGRSAQAIKNLILTGGQVSPSTEGLTLSGRRIRADGSLQCVDQTLSNRYAPAQDHQTVGVGTPVALGMLSITCEAPSSEPQVVTVAETGESITLVDASGTGQFEAVFTPSNMGTSTLVFPDGSQVMVTAIGSYDPAREVEFEYREIEGTELEMYDDSVIPITSPFPIRFAGAEPGLDTVYVGDNGVLSFTDYIHDYYNQPLPIFYAETLIAPFWDDLLPSGYYSEDSRIAYEVLGEAPNRELVIEWRDIAYFGFGGNATFQVVFFENSPNILFNYADVVFGTSYYDHGASATVGVQVTSVVAQQYSFNEASLSDGMALLWAMGAPSAAAGPNRAVSPGAAVTLDGRNSQDYDGTIVSYAWTQIAGTPVTLQYANQAVASFTAPQTPGTLTFRLQVTDDAGQTGTDTVDVIINLNPVADAGANLSVGTNLVGTLDGTGSHDPDGTVVGYHWQQVNGEPVEIRNANTPVAEFTAPATAQFLAFELTVTDEHGFTGRDVVVVNVFHNDAPVARAGQDRIVRPGAPVMLDGTDSHDPDGSIVSYQWTVDLCTGYAGPCEVDIIGLDTATPQLIAPEIPGVVHLTLTVTDNVGAVSSDSIGLGVFPQAPRAEVASSAVCATSGTTVVLDGQDSQDPDGTIVSYAWTQLAGPQVVLSGANTPVASFTAPGVDATLVFALTVTDDDGMIATAQLELRANTPPVAVATANATIVSAGTTVTLDGSQSQGETSYAWTQIGGTPVTLSNRHAAAPTFVAPHPGASLQLVTFELTVTDECGAMHADQVSVIVLGN